MCHGFGCVLYEQFLLAPGLNGRFGCVSCCLGVVNESQGVIRVRVMWTNLNGRFGCVLRCLIVVNESKWVIWVRAVWLNSWHRISMGDLGACHVEGVVTKSTW